MLDIYFLSTNIIEVHFLRRKKKKQLKHFLRRKKNQLNGPLRRDGFQFFCSSVDEISCIVNAFSTFVRRRLQYAPGFYLDRFVHLRCSRCCRCTCRIHLYCNMLHCCHTGDLKNTHRYLKQRKTFLLPFQEI